MTAQMVRIVAPAGTATARQRLNKHISLASYTQANNREILGSCVSYVVHANAI
jgi:hypothetical protein